MTATFGAATRLSGRAQAQARPAEPASRSPLTVSVVIPTKNEARNLGWVLEHLPACVDEVIVVDGQSTDGTVDVARAVRPDVVIVDERTPGKGAALRAGFGAARGDVIVMLDADGSMDPAEIDQFVSVLASGYDFAKGSRFAPGGGTSDMTMLRWLGNWGFVKATNILFRASFSDLCYGYCAFKRSVLPDLALTAQGFEIETELVLHAVKAHLAVAEIPSFESPRRFGESNLNTFRDGWRVFKTILRERIARTPRVELGGLEASLGLLLVESPEASYAADGGALVLSQLPTDVLTIGSIQPEPAFAMSLSDTNSAGQHNA
jgi:glycosyltransferase involved in cell wall biosynthesis